MADSNNNDDMILSVSDLPIVFEDVTPIPQVDGPVCRIDYTDKFIQAYNYLRAILKTKEYSERVLPLTALCLKLNPANYTVWHYRRQCLFYLLEQDKNDDDDPRIEKDLELAATLGGRNPKNYQIWYHRRALLEPSFVEKKNKDDADAAIATNLDMARTELAYVAAVLAEDGKNYHAWSHRQWIVRTIDDATLWKDELEYAHTLILEDVRNNSAWNQRWFASHKGRKQALLSRDDDDATKEANYAIQGATIDPYNESPWRYLIGIIKEQQPQQDADNASFLEFVKEFHQKTLTVRDVLEQKGRDADGCSNLTSALIDLLELKADETSFRLAAELANGLATKHDTIRRKYWGLRQTELLEAATAAAATASP